MSDSKQLVSIGMPVYNGEPFIRKALDSLLAQEYDNFELIISDNASTDGTADICREYVATDKRIRYYRNETNLGAVANFNRVFELSSGRYFMFAGAHDLWHPTFISRCSSILDSDLDVVLVYTRTMLIDPNANTLGLTPDQIDTRGMRAVARFKRIVWDLGWCNMIYGVIRKEVLSQTGMFRNVWGSDHVLLAELALKGSFAQIPEALFYRRKVRPDETPEIHKERVLLLMDPPTAFQHSARSIESLTHDMYHAHLDIVANAPTSVFEKVRLGLFVRFRFGIGRRLLLLAQRIPPYLKPWRYIRVLRMLLRKK